MIREIHPKGIGALELAFRQLRDKLAKGGFSIPGTRSRCRPTAGGSQWWTSPTGAAIRDFLEVRAAVGGEPTCGSFRSACRGGGGRGDRGRDRRGQPAGGAARLPCGYPRGGSLEDLWAFQRGDRGSGDLCVAVPVGFGRGARNRRDAFRPGGRCPSVDAERSGRAGCPGGGGVGVAIAPGAGRLAATLRSRLAAIEARLDNLGRRRVFRRPLEMVFERARRVDELEARQTRAMANLLKTARGRLDATAAQLDSLSPLAVLGRGYSITERLPSGEVVRDASALAPGERIRTRLASGGAISRIEEIEDA